MSRRALAIAVAAICAAAASCTPVRYHQKAAFSTRVMNLADSPLNTHFLQKTMYSIEGAAGGIGASAGGGCGCY